jgi:hypothetical protein
MLASNKNFTVWHGIGLSVIVLLVTMPVLVSGADDDKKSSVANPDHPRKKIESMARLTVQKQPGSVFKCWQEGRLVFEHTSPMVKKQKLANAITVRGDNDKVVQLLDLKQGLCVLSQQP